MGNKEDEIQLALHNESYNLMRFLLSKHTEPAQTHNIPIRDMVDNIIAGNPAAFEVLVFLLSLSL